MAHTITGMDAAKSEEFDLLMDAYAEAVHAANFVTAVADDDRITEAEQAEAAALNNVIAFINAHIETLIGKKTV